VEAGHETLGATGRIGTHLHRSGHGVRGVTVVVPGCDLGRELGDGIIDDLQQIGDRVRPGVARPQTHSQRLTGGVGEAEHRVEPEPALERRGRLILVLGMDLHQRRVDVQHEGLDVIEVAGPDPCRCEFGGNPTPQCMGHTRTRRRSRPQKSRVNESVSGTVDEALEFDRTRP
jgi:hypothetical protein